MATPPSPNIGCEATQGTGDSKHQAGRQGDMSKRVAFPCPQWGSEGALWEGGPCSDVPCDT